MQTILAPSRVDRSAAERVTRADFVGIVHMQAIRRAADSTAVEILAVFFEPGARTRPHIHPTEQVLHVVEGEGVVATETELQIVRAGDIVVVPSGEWHWHGATPDSAMCHLSLKPGPGLTNWSPPERNWAKYMDI